MSLSLLITVFCVGFRYPFPSFQYLKSLCAQFRFMLMFKAISDENCILLWRPFLG